MRSVLNGGCCERRAQSEQKEPGAPQTKHDAWFVIMSSLLKKGMDLNVALKSFSGRSFRQQSISGGFWFDCWHNTLMVLMISEIAKNAFCPEEQSNSATLIQLGKFKFIIISSVFRTKTGFAISRTLLYTNQKKRQILKKKGLETIIMFHIKNRPDKFEC